MDETERAPGIEPTISQPQAPPRRRRRLGEMLVGAGVISVDQLAEVLELQKREKGKRLGRLVVDLGYATEGQVAEAIAAQLKIPAADLVAVDIPNDVLGRVDRELAMKHLCLPWFVEGKDLYLIMADPTDLVAADAIAFHTGLNVKPVVAAESEVEIALERFYAAEESSLAQFDNLDMADQLSVESVEPEAATDFAEDAISADSPVVRLVNAMLVDAIRQGASDIHIEPQATKVQLRYRVDGLLHNVMTLPRLVHPKVISRIKIMGHMDISERRIPQDGRAFIRIGPKKYDLRISTLPTADGEKIVGRLLVQERAQVSLDDEGFAEDTLATFKELLARPQGMMLVTGPTGSGKTTTLYAGLNLILSETTNIVTIEDPVEYRLPGVNQVAVAPKAGLTFAAGLRSILRQDPDVIMVGEIRDPETAQVAMQAAQTGHLVLSTLHTNDATSALTRLVNLGLPAYGVASSVLGVLAQRLVLKLCKCKELRDDGSATPKGCEICRFSGFKGRTAVAELMRLTPRISSVLIAGASADLLRRAASASGMRTMYAEALRKVAAGVTTIEQVNRVVPPDEFHLDEEPDHETPGEPPPETAVPLRLADAAHDARPTRILVVDDEPNMLEIVRELLEDQHYDVVTAGDGNEALASVYRDNPDLVLTDLRMPGMDGLELVRRLRGDLSRFRIPVLFLTAVTDIDTEMKALDLGADDFIGKPLERGRLLSRVRRALFRAHMMQSAS